jgi:glycosyltransferase involved in cell wall biosynthesis
LRIAHLCLSCFYIDGYGYQENELVRQHLADGHNVFVIASTENYGPDGKITYVAPSTYMGSEGAPVTRLDYRRVLPDVLMRKLRMHSGVYEQLSERKPDIILFHGLCGWELHAAARYKRENPSVRLYVDSHEDENNSARTFLSKYLLHRLYYRWVIHRCIPTFDKILCVSLETIEFVKKNYGIPADRLEFYPLGGYVFADDEYFRRRSAARAECGIAGDQILLVQTGKMGRRKKVLESLDAFMKTEGANLRFVLAGVLDNEVRDEATQRIDADARISFVGWKTSEQLKDLLCAADVYVQPGTQSATMQMSLCARCPVVLDDVLSHRPFVDGNGWLVKDGKGLESAFTQIRNQPELLGRMSVRSREIAQRLLDYRLLAARILR